MAEDARTNSMGFLDADHGVSMAGTTAYPYRLTSSKPPNNRSPAYGGGPKGEQQARDAATPGRRSFRRLPELGPNAIGAR